MGFDLISLILCRGTELWPDCRDETILGSWASFVTSVGLAVLATPKPLQSDLGLLNIEPFQQAGMEEKDLNALRVILKTLVGNSA